MRTGPDQRASFRCSYLVAPSDVDDSGVMHFARYPALVETALFKGLAGLGCGLTELRKLGCQLAVSRLEVHYRSPVKLLEELTAHAWLTHLGGVQLRVDGAVHNAASGDRLAELSMVLAVLDGQTGRPTRLPAAMHDRLDGLRFESELDRSMP